MAIEFSGTPRFHVAKTNSFNNCTRVNIMSPDVVMKIAEEQPIDDHRVVEPLTSKSTRNVSGVSGRNRLDLGGYLSEP